MRPTGASGRCGPSGRICRLSCDNGPVRSGLGTGAFELLVERNGFFRPEPGPNMMWNTKCGHMAGWGGYGMMGGYGMGYGMIGG
jgi:hypothetical protein